MNDKSFVSALDAQTCGDHVKAIISVTFNKLGIRDKELENKLAFILANTTAAYMTGLVMMDINMRDAYAGINLILLSFLENEAASVYFINAIDQLYRAQMKWFKEEAKKRGEDVSRLLEGFE